MPVTGNPSLPCRWLCPPPSHTAQFPPGKILSSLLGTGCGTEFSSPLTLLLPLHVPSAASKPLVQNHDPGLPCLPDTLIPASVRQV